MSALTGVLAMGRAQAVARMTEAITVTTTAAGVLNETTGQYTDVVTTHYTGVARLKFSTLNVAARDSADRLIAVQDVALHVPAGTALLPVGASVAVTASDADPSLLSRLFTVEGRPHAGQTTAHRYPVAEVS